MQIERPPIPSEQLPLSYFDHVILAVRSADGAISISISDLADAIGISRSTAIRRIRNHSILGQGLNRFTVTTAGGPQAQDFLALEQTPALLLMINSARTKPEIRPRLEHLQLYLVRETYAAFMKLSGLPTEESREIEDLDDLRRLDTSLNILEERQTQIEQSQDRARMAWRELSIQIRELTERIHQLEAQNVTISRAQRGVIYQLVQTWAQAKAEQEPRLSTSAAYASCWASFKIAFRLARYEDLPAHQYAEAKIFIQEAYTRLTGSSLQIPEQQEFEL